MNCFEWMTRSSDYLDGALMGAKKIEADAHLDSCVECSERHKHYRIILTSIASQPRSALPISMRRAPFSSVLPSLDLGLNRSRWEKIPWYLRTTLEATGLVLLTLAAVSSGPRIRALYELKIEKNLSDFSQVFSDAPRSEPKTADQAPLLAAPALDANKATDEFTSESEESQTDEENESKNDQEIRVGNSDIWRFILRTDSPHEIRPKIVTLLKSLVPAGSEIAGHPEEGISAPGGIQFDLIIPQTAIAQIKRQLFDLAPPAPEGLADTPSGETFTWYKIKSKRKIPVGKARVVIWISQI